MKKFLKICLLSGVMIVNSSCFASMCMPVVNLNGEACCTLTQKEIIQKLANISTLQQKLPELEAQENDFFIKSSIKNTINVLKLSQDSINMTSAIYDLYKSLEKITKKRGATEISNELCNQCKEILK
jgi:uncharacterized Zn finger protein (UPF0148 family)